MTQDEILEMGFESGLCYKSNGFVDWIDAGPCLHEMTLFAKLVKAKATEREREACAKIADEWAVGWPHPSQSIAERIRERGEK